MGSQPNKSCWDQHSHCWKNWQLNVLLYLFSKSFWGTNSYKYFLCTEQIIPSCRNSTVLKYCSLIHWSYRSSSAEKARDEQNLDWYPHQDCIHQFLKQLLFLLDLDILEASSKTEGCYSCQCRGLSDRLDQQPTELIDLLLWYRFNPEKAVEV